MDWNGLWTIFIPGFYFLWHSFVRAFLHALPEDRNAASWSQHPVALSHGHERD